MHESDSATDFLPDRKSYAGSTDGVANACSYSSYPKPYPSTNSSRDADACPYPCAIDTGANGTNADSNRITNRCAHPRQ